MLLHKNPAASLPVVFLLRPEQTLFSCPSLGEITTGKCFPSHTLSWLEIIYMELIWKFLPSPSSAGYLQATGESRGEAGRSRNLLSRMKRVGEVSVLSNVAHVHTMKSPRAPEGFGSGAIPGSSLRCARPTGCECRN